MTKYSVKKPFTVLVGVLLVLVLGVVSFLGLNTDLLPAMDLPYVVVYTVYPGASPERVEVAVTQPLEQAVATTSGLENLQSISSENVSIIIMEFSGSTNMDSAMIELSNSIDMVSGYLDDMVQSPTLMKINPDMLPVQTLAVDVDGMDIKQLSEYVKNELAPRLERLDGVATVDVSGTVEDHVDIRLNQAKIDEINDSVLKAVNNELYKTKKELDKAKAELADGKTKLENREKEAFDKLAAASTELDAGQAQLIAVTAEKTRLEAEKKLWEGVEEVNKQIAELQKPDSKLSLFQKGILAMGSKLPPVPGMTITDESTLAEVKAVVDAIINSGMLPDTTELAGLNAGIDSMIATGMVKESTQVKNIVTSGCEFIKQQAIAGGLPREWLAKTGREITAAKASIDEQMIAANALAKAMENTIKELKASYAQLEAAKMQATAELAAGSVRIENGQKQLDDGIKQFEDARDTALKQANINSLVTQEMLANILMAQNFSMPAGYIADGLNEMTVKVGETFSTIEELENLLLVDMGMKGVDPIYLKDVADISIADNSGDSYVVVNGNPGINLSIQKSSTASTSRVSGLVNKEIREIMEEDTAVHITQLMDQGVFIEMVVSSVMDNMIYGGIIALFVLLFFLKDLMPTLIIGFSIPLSVLFAIVMMYFSGVNLNTMSLSGLALGIGMLVDNSIVVIENVYRLRNLGYSKVKAAVIGAQQVAGAIASSTLTTICVFVPIVFTDGLTRQLFVDMGLTIAFSLIASLVVALTVVPAMASFMLNKTKDYDRGITGRMTKGYEKLLAKALDHKWLTIGFCVAMLGVSVYGATKMPMVLIPAMDSTQMQMTLTMPGETSDADLIKDAEIIAQRVQRLEDVDTVGITLGGGGLSALMGGGSSDTKSASFYVVLKETKSLSNEEIREIIKEKTPEYSKTLSVTANTMDLGALAGSGISVQLKGNDLDTLQSEAKRLSDLLMTVEGIKKVNDGSGSAVEEVRIEVNKKAAMEKGLTVAQVFSKVSAALTEEKTATTLNFGGYDMDAIIYTATTYSKSTIGDLVVATETKDGKDKDILLSDIATIGTATSPQSIGRDNQSRYVTVSASIADGYNATLVARDVEKAMEGYEMPAGYSYRMTGEDETIMKAMFDMVKMIALAIVFIYLIMVAQFQSLKSPFIVMFTIPLAFTGGLLALMITGTELSITAMIGFLVLAGVVVNNGIVFVDYVNQLRIEGADKRRALLQTGKDRIRPILMTAMTTILANSTLAMGVGMGAELSQGMALVSIGGLAYATLLTLFLVPALYDIFNKGEIKVLDVDFEDEGL